MDNLQPMNVDAEEAVIGSLLIDGESIYEIASLLKPEDFYRERNRWAYEACLALYSRSEAINQVTLAHELKDKLEALGGGAYLSHVVSQVPTSIHIKHYANIVSRTAFQRKVMASAETIASIAQEKEQPAELISECMKVLIQLRPPGRQTILRPKERAEQALDTLSRRYEGEVDTLPFGFLDLDRETGGMARGDLILIGARPEMAKSTLAQQIANTLACQGKIVLLCSAEMSSVQYTDRELVSKTGISIQNISKGELNDKEWGDIQKAISGISESPLYFKGGRSLTTADIAYAGKEVSAEVGLDCIVVDYIQLLADSKGDSLNERVSHISRHLKQIAGDLEVPVLAVSQLNRELERREDKRPKLSDLRDSGSLEQDADIVLLLYRADVYYPDEKSWKASALGRRGEPYEPGILQVLVTKHRQWGSGNRVVKLVWNHERRQYRDLYKER